MLENAAMEAIRFQPPAYEPTMRGSAGEQTGCSRWSSQPRAQRVFPEHAPDPAEIPDTARPQARHRCSTRFPASATPCPPTCRPSMRAVDAAMSSASWRFLLRLNPEGSVVECVSLENGDEAGRARAGEMAAPGSIQAGTRQTLPLDRRGRRIHQPTRPMELTLADFVLYVLLGSFALVPIARRVFANPACPGGKTGAREPRDLPALPARLRGHQPRQNRRLPDLRRSK